MDEYTNVAFVTDIHGDVDGLTEVIHEIRRDWPSIPILCGGDIVDGKMNQIQVENNTCIELVRQECEYVVFGNHDARYRPDFEYSPSHPTSQDRYETTLEQIGRTNDYLASLDDRIETDQFVLAHSRPFRSRDPGYPPHGFSSNDLGLSKGDATRIGPYLDGRVAFVGHTHKLLTMDVDKFAGQSGTIVWGGSVGVRPNEADYSIVNLRTRSVQQHTVEY